MKNEYQTSRQRGNANIKEYELSLINSQNGNSKKKTPQESKVPAKKKLVSTVKKHDEQIGAPENITDRTELKSTMSETAVFESNSSEPKGKIVTTGQSLQQNVMTEGEVSSIIPGEITEADRLIVNNIYVEDNNANGAFEKALDDVLQSDPLRLYDLMTEAWKRTTLRESNSHFTVQPLANSPENEA